MFVSSPLSVCVYALAPLSPINNAAGMLAEPGGLFSLVCKEPQLQSQGELPCRVQRTALHSRLPHPPALTFLQSPPQCSLSLEAQGRGPAQGLVLSHLF